MEQSYSGYLTRGVSSRVSVLACIARNVQAIDGCRYWLTGNELSYTQWSTVAYAAMSNGCLGVLQLSVISTKCVSTKCPTSEYRSWASWPRNMAAMVTLRRTSFLS